MKKFIVLIALIGLVFFTSCEKQALPEGRYEFVFKSTTGAVMQPVTLLCVAVESTKEYLILENNWTCSDTLYKDGKNITGTITHHGTISGMGRNMFFGPFHITGICDKKKGKHYISGTFASEILVPNVQEEKLDTTYTSGTFEFKQYFGI